MSFNSDLCKGRTALVTGAARGIGSAIATMLAKHGANVVLNARTDSDALAETLANVERHGVTAMSSVGDVSDPAYINDLTATATRQFGSIDILINNAGIIIDKPLVFMKEKEWNDVLGVTLGGTYNCSKAVIKGMMT